MDTINISNLSADEGMKHFTLASQRTNSVSNMLARCGANNCFISTKSWGKIIVIHVTDNVHFEGDAEKIAAASAEVNTKSEFEKFISDPALFTRGQIVPDDDETGETKP